LANGHGGARIGAGRKKKSEEQKRLEGRIPVKSKGKKLKGTDIEGNDCPEPHEYMNMTTKNASENIAKKIYGEIYDWLKKRRCEHLVQPHLIEQYSLSFARYSQAETVVHQFGMFAKSQTNGNPVPSPFIEISQTYLKQSQNLWLSIYSIIKDSCNEYPQTEEDDIMEKILTGRL
jgi:phage terminase small subunit